MATLKNVTDAQKLVSTLREHVNAGVTAKRDWRVAQLEALRRMIVDNEELLEAALRQDLGKSTTEAQLTEIGVLLGDIDDALKNLADWLKPRRVGVPLALMPARAYTVAEPLGVVLIMAPWNYPLMLLLSPLVGALAAGNAVVIKPSEVSAATSKVIAQLVPAYLDPRGVAVVEGAVTETTWLLDQYWDHIFYTGNGTVGRIVMAAAARNLTPVTLELGGKSPLFIDETVDLEAAAERIAWAKFLNAGQTCVAPDYVLGTPDVLAQLEPHLVSAIAALYGPDPASSEDYGRIINKAHFDRLIALLKSGRVVTDGKPNATKRYIPPTVLGDVPRDSAIMQEEIFGPILPLVPVADLADAIAFICSRPKPLALYAFTEDTRVRRRFTEQTSSGALVFNVAVVHLSILGLAFGGVGESGMGGYRGKHTFTTFSHMKSLVSKGFKPETLSLVYPPYTETKKSLVRGLLRRLS